MQLLIPMSKNKGKNRRKAKILDALFTVVPLLLIIAFLSRCIPDGTVRLNIGKSGIGEKAIALTFDDGPSDYTEELLDGLLEYEVSVTFFVIGNKAEKRPEIVKRAYDEGHLIGNHTYNHLDFYKSDVDEIKESILKGETVIEEITGKKPLFLRAPYGHVGIFQLKKLDSFFIHWSASTYDWYKEDADFVYNRIMDEAKDGAIILLHDTKKTTVEAVLRAIPELLDQGYEFVRVDDLLSRNGDRIRMGTPYRSCKYNRGAISF